MGLKKKITFHGPQDVKCYGEVEIKLNYRKESHMVFVPGVNGEPGHDEPMTLQFHRVIGTNLQTGRSIESDEFTDLTQVDDVAIRMENLILEDLRLEAYSGPVKTVEDQLRKRGYH